MNKASILPAVGLLAGCAGPVVAPAPDGGQVAGTLMPDWREHRTVEVRLDGKRYAGEWTSKPCFTSRCRGVYWNVPRIHRAHVRAGEATLAAGDGSRLECRWVSHPPELDGHCTTQDGRLFKLRLKTVQG